MSTHPSSAAAAGAPVLSIVSPSGSDVGSKRPRIEGVENESERLRTQNKALQEQVEILQRQVAGLAGSTSPKLHGMHHPATATHLRSKSSVLSSGLEVRITEAEMHAMRAIFGLFDRDGSGTISAADLRALHQKLGEPITEEEARDAVRDIGQGRDVITFDDFVMYWDGTHPSLRATVTANPVVASKFKYSTGAGAGAGGAAPSSAVVSRASSFDGADVLASALPTGSGLPSASHGAGAGGFMLSPSVDAATRERKRQWYQARFKFLRAKLANPTVARVYAEEAGAPCTLEWRLRFFYDAEDGRKVQISPWHDIPYKNDNGTYNMLVEIPKWSRRKYEVATGEPFNNIKQDVKNGVLREYGYGDMLFNYGCIPQTWEDPHKRHEMTGTLGDNDPIDVVDIGSKMWTCGSLVAVKVLGVLGMIDSGETDWKLIAINVEDPMAPLLTDIEDVEVHLPGAVEALHRWLKLYKTPLINEFAFEGKAQGRKFAEALVEETHEDWERLVGERGLAATVSKEETH